MYPRSILLCGLGTRPVHMIKLFNLLTLFEHQGGPYACASCIGQTALPVYWSLLSPYVVSVYLFTCLSSIRESLILTACWLDLSMQFVCIREKKYIVLSSKNSMGSYSRWTGLGMHQHM